MGAESQRRWLRIRGRVQGVFYRASAQREAVRLGLTGWVRNRRDGSVEALAVGPRPAALDAFETWCRTGPPSARVESVEPQGPPGEDLPAVDATFEILRTS